MDQQQQQQQQPSSSSSSSSRSAPPPPKRVRQWGSHGPSSRETTSDDNKMNPEAINNNAAATTKTTISSSATVQQTLQDDKPIESKLPLENKKKQEHKGKRQSSTEEVSYRYETMVFRLFQEGLIHAKNTRDHQAVFNLLDTPPWPTAPKDSPNRVKEVEEKAMSVIAKKSEHLKSKGFEMPREASNPPIFVLKFVLYLLSDFAQHLKDEPELQQECVQRAEALCTWCKNNLHPSVIMLDEEVNLNLIRMSFISGREAQGLDLLEKMKAANLTIRYRTLQPVLHAYTRGKYPFSKILDQLKEQRKLISTSSELRVNQATTKHESENHTSTSSSSSSSKTTKNPNSTGNMNNNNNNNNNNTVDDSSNSLVERTNICDPEYIAVFDRIVRGLKPNSDVDAPSRETIQEILKYYCEDAISVPSRGVIESLIRLFDACGCTISYPFVMKPEAVNCPECNGRLLKTRMTPSEYDRLIEKAEELAISNGALSYDEQRREKFNRFKVFLDRNEHNYDCVVDAANVGFYSITHNSGPGGIPPRIHFVNIEAMMRHISHNGLRPLLIIHERHLTPYVRNSPELGPIVHGWDKRNLLYPVPHNNNDDWYWFYAAARITKNGGYFLTNDCMRDHVRDLEAIVNSNELRAWQNRHRIYFHIYTMSPLPNVHIQTFSPPAYENLMHFCEESNKWHIPEMLEPPAESATHSRHAPAFSSPFAKYSWFCASSPVNNDGT